jgi:hypothetical protein
MIQQGITILSNSTLPDFWGRIPSRIQRMFALDSEEGEHSAPFQTEPPESSFHRVCPGRLLADASLFISCAMTLAVFIIKPTEDGAPVDSEQSTGIIKFVLPLVFSSNLAHMPS